MNQWFNEWSNACASKHLSNLWLASITGLVPKPKSEVAKDREVLGKEYDNGWIRSLRSDGSALVASAGQHPEGVARGRGPCLVRPLAFRCVSDRFAFGRLYFWSIDSRRLPTFNSSLTGMHRKSLEAADKLKDCESDGESREMSERSAGSPQLVPNGAQRSAPKDVRIGPNDKTSSLSPLSPPITSSNSIYNSVLTTNEKSNVKEEFRTCSIAALRAKALEHCAKVSQIAAKPNDTSNNSLFATNRLESHPHSPSSAAHFHQSSPTRHHIF